MPTLAALSLSDLRLGLDDLFDNRKAALEASHVGKKIYGPKLANVRAQIDGTPEQIAKLPYAEELENADARHDGYGAALYHLTEAYLAWPDAPESMVAAAKSIRAAFIPALGALTARYEDEVQAAKVHKPLLKSTKDDLEAIPIGPKGTALDWAKQFVAQGEEIGVLLAKRAAAMQRSTDASHLGVLRGRVLAILGKFRSALADEVSEDEALPRDLDARVFGYFDQLMRNAAHRHRKSDASAPATGGAAGSGGAPPVPNEGGT